MDLKQLVAMQSSMDEVHGFPLKFSGERERLDQLMKDMVGLFGEVGELANVIKKMDIKLEHPAEYELDLRKAEDAVKEELADVLIYAMRISVILGIDLETELIKKMNYNMVRYNALKKK